jgi:hypothetical protein
MDNAEDRLAAIPMEAKKLRKKKSLQTVADAEKGFHHFLFMTKELRTGATTEMAAQAVPGTSLPTASSNRFASWTMPKVANSKGKDANIIYRRLVA